MTSLAPENAPLAVELVHLAKRFGAVQANSNIALQVRKGTVHAVIGENGAGKSTAMKMLYGMVQPDSGEILVHGKTRKWRSPSDAIAAGLGMVHQHFMLADPISAVENVVLGARGKGVSAWFRGLDLNHARARLESLSREYQMPVEWDRPVGDLAVGVQQRIEILKLLYRDADILILDEPTAVLTPQETQDLFKHLRFLCERGKTIIIITHKLKEVMALADDVTVFRAGRVVGQCQVRDTDPDRLAEMMVGRKVRLMSETSHSPTAGSNASRAASASSDAEVAPLIEIRDFSVRDRGTAKPVLDAISLRVFPGEIVGIAGVEGNGQSELIRALLHAGEWSRQRARLVNGDIRVLSQDVLQSQAGAIREAGVGLVPEDRHRDGLLLDQSLEENFLLGLQRDTRFRSSGGYLISEQGLRAAANRALEDFDVRPRNLHAIARGLSGGNQQKWIIAREIERKPRLLVAAQPTRGVDVGAIEFIHDQLRELRAQGVGILLISSELDEILALSDRVVVFFDGKINGEFERARCDVQTLGLRMGGGQ